MLTGGTTTPSESPGIELTEDIKPVIAEPEVVLRFPNVEKLSPPTLHFKGLAREESISENEYFC